MIYLVDMTCYSTFTVRRLTGKLRAKYLSYVNWASLVSNSAVWETYANAIWVFVWDDSPFTGYMFDEAMRQGLIAMDKSFFVETNDSQKLAMWRNQLMRDIEEKFGCWRNHAYVIPMFGGREEDKLCYCLLSLEQKLADAKKLTDEFSALWDAFEMQLKDHIVKSLASKYFGEPDFGKTMLSAIYSNIGGNFWHSDRGLGRNWQYNTIWQLHRYDNLDTLVSGQIDRASMMNAEEIYSAAVKPLLDIRKQELVETFTKMTIGSDDSQPSHFGLFAIAHQFEVPAISYQFKIPIDDRETALKLGFRKRYEKRNQGGMDGYRYSFNGRIYEDIQPFATPAIEMLSSNVCIAKDAFGEMLLRRHTEIPTFDSGDREWDSEENEYLMFDGKDIHLVTMRGGYRIARLTFYEKMLTADARMKPIFKKLGWPADSIVWD